MQISFPRPQVRPLAPSFSSGPCTKRPGWSIQNLNLESLGRSHRSTLGRARLKLAIDLTRQILNIPEDYHIGIVAGSDTGAVEMALWSLLGPRPVDLLAWESFGSGWVNDVVKQLKLEHTTLFEADYGYLPDLKAVNTKEHDVVFTWNGTTSGVRIPDADWIAADRKGLTICDATSAAFAQRLDFTKLDVVTFSWQKVLGGEAAHGMLILSPRAVERLETYNPPWPMPKLFRMTKKGKLDQGIFVGDTINTPSMLAVEDYIDALAWAHSIGGLNALVEKADGNAKILQDWIDRTVWVSNLAQDPATASNTSVCLLINDADITRKGTEFVAKLAKGMVSILAEEKAAYDIGSYRDAPPGLRIWCGATVEADDLKALLPWLEWAFQTEKAKLLA